MDKNISPDSKSNQLVALLNENIEKSGEKMNKARIRLMSMIIIALFKVQTVGFHKFALAFDNASTSDSSLRRRQRFIAGFDLCSDLIARLIFGLLPEKTGLRLVIDRTNWKFGEQNINIFMFGIAYRNVAFPLVLTMLDKKGNSNSDECISLINRFVKLLYDKRSKRRGAEDI